MACSSPDSKSARVRVRPPGVGTSTGLAVGRTESTEVQKGGGKRKEPGLKADVDRPFGQHRRARTLRPFVRSSVRSFVRSFARWAGQPEQRLDGRTDGRTDEDECQREMRRSALVQPTARESCDVATACESEREREPHGRRLVGLPPPWPGTPRLAPEGQLEATSRRRLCSPLSALRSPQPQRPPGVASVPGLAPLLAETRRRLDVCI